MMFYQFDLDLDLETSLFDSISNSINFEPITKCRLGANCFSSSDNTTPLVRTTTIYSNPIQKFAQPYNLILHKIKSNSI